MKVALIGATGFVGTAILKELLCLQRQYNRSFYANKILVLATKSEKGES